MKHLVSLLAIGMSTFVAAEHEITHEAIFKDNSKILMDAEGSVTVEITNGSKIICEALPTLGTAFGDYENFESTAQSVDAPTRHQYSKESTLAYKCGIRNSQNEQQEFQQPPILFDSLQGTEFVRVDFTGSCETESIVFDNSRIHNNGTYDGSRNFRPNITTQLTYGCKQSKQFKPSVNAEVMLSPLEAASSIVINETLTTNIQNFSTDNGLIYKSTSVLEFDLGTDAPDFAYYVASASCQSGLCKGALTLSAGTAKLSLVTDLMDSSLMNRAQTPSFTNCSTQTLNEERLYTLREACYGAKTEETILSKVAGHLLVPLMCPFTSDAMSDSSQASIDECLAAGEETFDNRCQASLDRVNGTSSELGKEYTYDLHASKSFTYTFNDQEEGTAKRFRTVEKVEMTGPPLDIILTADMVYFDTTLHLAENETFADLIEGAMNFRVLADTGWSQRVKLVGTSLTVTGIPKNTKNLTLVGDVRTSCDLEELELSNEVVLNFYNKAALAFGDFRQTDPCSNVYLFYRSEIGQDQKNLTIASIHGVKTDAADTVKVCGDSTADCDTVYSDVIQTGSSVDQFALIDDACNYEAEISPGVTQTVYLSKNAVAGYVEFENELALFAPIKCAGACHSREIRLPDLSLDWEIDFKVSTTEYELSAKQETADWNDFTQDANGHSFFTMHKVSYLAESGSDLCLPDGSVSGDVPTSGNTTADPKGCLVFKDASDPTNNDAFGQGTVEYTGITGSADMRNWIAACGSYLEDGMGAKAQLVQRFEVDYVDGYVRTPSQLPSIESFCDSKDLTLFVEQKIVGASYGELTIAQVSAVEQSPDIQASIGSFDYEACDSGGYRVVATVDLHHNLDPSLFQNVDFAGSSADFDDTSINNAKDVLTWKTQCADVCGSQATTLDSWTNGTGHLLKAVVTADDQNINHNKGAESDIELKLALKGTPCDVEKTWDGGEASLTLYAAPEGDCSVNDDVVALGSTPSADGAICGRFEFSNMGEFELTITGTEVSRRTDGTLAAYLCEDADSPQSCIGYQSNMFRGRLFDIGGKWNSVNHTQASNGNFSLDLDDAFTTIKYTIYWEQNYMGTARRLRSEHVFGEGQEASVAELVILPPHAQISDSAQSDTLSETSTEQNFTPEEEEDIKEKVSDNHTMTIIIIILVSVSLVFGVGFCVKNNASGQKKFAVNIPKPGNLKSKGYMKVRQDRFTTGVF